jgi:probable F420-dependent oxidoreductase
MDATGVMFSADRMTGGEYTDYARRLESLGFDTVWVPELFGREPFAAAAHLLANTSTITVATGIANVYARDATATAQGRRTLAELSGGRFALGLGVSNAAMAVNRGHEWEAPADKLRRYLAEMDDATLMSPEPLEPAPVYIAAHGPRLLELTAEVADGANTWLMTVGHTARARAILGPDASLSVARMCLLCDDADEARRLARKAVALYLTLPHYRRAWAEDGFGADDFEDGGSDRLIDTLVAWGDAPRIEAALAEHRDAGADHLVVVPLNRRGGGQPDWDLLEALAAARPARTLGP